MSATSLVYRSEAELNTGGSVDLAGHHRGTWCWCLRGFVSTPLHSLLLTPHAGFIAVPQLPCFLALPPLIADDGRAILFFSVTDKQLNILEQLLGP